MLVSKELGGCRTLLCYGGSVVTGLKWQSYFRAFCFGFPFFSDEIATFTVILRYNNFWSAGSVDPVPDIRTS